MDDFVSLYNRLLSRAPGVGVVLAQQLVNDSFRTFQAKKEWSFRRRSGAFAPPTLYLTGTASTNVATGSPNLITGVGTAWTPEMIGRQIRLGGLIYPYYTIVGWLSATQLLIDQPWAGPDVSGVTHQILQCYFPVPIDFGYFYVAVSIKDAYRLWTNLTQADLAMMDPQRTNIGQTYAAAFRDYAGSYGGTIGPVIPVTDPTHYAPISTTSTGFSYVANATYVIQVVSGGVSGTATFKWLRAGQLAFQPAQVTSDEGQDLSDGVQIYWPGGVIYAAGDLFVINCVSQVTASVPRVELWPAPTINSYLYPYQYIAKVYDLTPQAPQLPPFVANRGEVILEMALEKAATFPGADAEHRNSYFDLRLAELHRVKVFDLMIELENEDENLNITKLDYQNWQWAGPFLDGSWQQRHAMYLA